MRVPRVREELRVNHNGFLKELREAFPSMGPTESKGEDAGMVVIGVTRTGGTKMKVGQLGLEEIPNGIVIVVQDCTPPTEGALCRLAGSNGSDSDLHPISTERKVSTRSAMTSVNGSVRYATGRTRWPGRNGLCALGVRICVRGRARCRMRSEGWDTAGDTNVTRARAMIVWIGTAADGLSRTLGPSANEE